MQLGFKSFKFIFNQNATKVQKFHLCRWFPSSGHAFNLHPSAGSRSYDGPLEDLRPFWGHVHRQLSRLRPYALHRTNTKDLALKLSIILEGDWADAQTVVS